MVETHNRKRKIQQ